jgi:hypothetical protein
MLVRAQLTALTYTCGSRLLGQMLPRRSSNRRNFRIVSRQSCADAAPRTASGGFISR